MDAAALHHTGFNGSQPGDQPNGSAVFNNVVPAVYTVCEVQQAGWYTITPTAPNPSYGLPCYSFSVNPGADTLVSFGDSTTP